MATAPEPHFFLTTTDWKEFAFAMVKNACGIERIPIYLSGMLAGSPVADKTDMFIRELQGIAGKNKTAPQQKKRRGPKPKKRKTVSEKE